MPIKPLAAASAGDAAPCAPARSAGHTRAYPAAAAPGAPAGAAGGAAQAAIGAPTTPAAPGDTAQLPRYRIGEAARRCGVGAANIRYYEAAGLLAPQARAGNRYRLYSDADLHRLRFVRLCRALDMSLDEVRSLLALQAGTPDECARARATLSDHLGHVRERLQELAALEADLSALRDRCDGREEHCSIIATLHARADAALPGDPGAPGARRGHV